MMRNYQPRIRTEDVDWLWQNDTKRRVQTLTLTHTPTKTAVSGELRGQVPAHQLQGKKRDLFDDLLEKLEEAVVNERALQRPKPGTTAT